MNSALEAALAALRQRFIDELPTRLDGMHQALAAMGAAAHDGPARLAARRAAHSLAGAGGTFGFPALGAAARSLELFLDAEAGTPAELATLFAALETEATRAVSGPPPASSAAPAAPAGEKRQRPTRSISLVDDDQSFGAHLAVQIGRFGYDVTHYPSLEAFLAALEDTPPPDAVIMDLSFPEGDLAGAEALLAQRLGRLAETPAVMISSRGDFAARLAAVRAGARAFVTKPPDLGVLINTLDGLTGDEPPQPYRILVVDDDALLAEHYCRLLEADGMETMALGDPTRALEAAADFNPDLLLTDLDMPGCSGIELAAVIRQLEAWVSLPIVFLSAETDLDRRALAMQHGGDDFLSKPVTAQGLIASVRQRAQRHRVLRTHMEHDGLTGLLNHSALKERLVLELARAERLASPLALVMIDLDHFKQVNDSHGHAAGDRVLRALARLLRDRLRRTDIIGRYGGEEFGALLPDTDAATAAQVVEKLRAAFAAIEHGAGEQRFRVTLSAGIAASPPIKDSETLAAAADAALYRSKLDGRNRVSLHQEADPPD
ncbi:MAG: diguanylate cyclase [Sulfuritalea sp.]|nr:diguanylate cyclase [Sulfuritalea sp.]